MKIGIISDIHANLEALQTALNFLSNRVEQIYCLGDVVGYGPNPNECVDLVREQCSLVLMGNHDYAAIGKANIEYFNEFARIATFWTQNQLTPRSKQYLEMLPFTHQTDEFVMVHASPTNPAHWYYVLSAEEARIEMQAFVQPVCFIGHSHVPVVYSLNGTLRQEMVKFEQNGKYIVNVGSVGQPRDRDARSSVVIYDQEEKTVQYH
ncbi:MAG TPA: metallophosphoesterase, partial [Caldithrix abyssi]|nr:metallophosphoesterase [Caldithrix abyssi]